MRPRTFQLTQTEIQAFEQAERETRTAIELRRLQGVRMYGSGLDIGLIKQVTGAPRRTIANWVGAYQSRGLVGLKPGWKGGTNRKLSVVERARVIQRLQHSTSAEGFWDREQVQVVVEQEYGKRYQSRESYRQLLIEAGFSFQQPESIYRSRPSDAVIAEFEADTEKKSLTSSKITRKDS